MTETNDRAAFLAANDVSRETSAKVDLIISTFRQAVRIEGVTPGALTALLGHVKRVRRTR